MITMFGFGNMETGVCFGGRATAYRFKAEGHVMVYVREIPYWSLLTVVIHPRERYVVTHPKRFVFCELVDAELKLEPFAAQLGLAS